MNIATIFFILIFLFSGIFKKEDFGVHALNTCSMSDKSLSTPLRFAKDPLSELTEDKYEESKKANEAFLSFTDSPHLLDSFEQALNIKHFSEVQNLCVEPQTKKVFVSKTVCQTKTGMILKNRTTNPLTTYLPALISKLLQVLEKANSVGIVLHGINIMGSDICDGVPMVDNLDYLFIYDQGKNRLILESDVIDLGFSEITDQSLDTTISFQLESIKNEIDTLKIDLVGDEKEILNNFNAQINAVLDGEGEYRDFKGNKKVSILLQKLNRDILDSTFCPQDIKEHLFEIKMPFSEGKLTI